MEGLNRLDELQSILGRVSVDIFTELFRTTDTHGEGVRWKLQEALGYIRDARNSLTLASHKITNENELV